MGESKVSVTYNLLTKYIRTTYFGVLKDDSILDRLAIATQVRPANAASEEVFALMDGDILCLYSFISREERERLSSPSGAAELHQWLSALQLDEDLIERAEQFGSRELVGHVSSMDHLEM